MPTYEVTAVIYVKFTVDADTVDAARDKASDVDFCAQQITHTDVTEVVDVTKWYGRS